MNKFFPSLLLSLVFILGLAACGQSDTSAPTTEAKTSGTSESAEMTKDASSSDNEATNPFYQASSLYMQFPAFDQISNADYAPAFEKGMADNIVEMDAIANNSEPATFENTFIPMEQGGQILGRTASVFFALASADTNDDIKALRTEIAPKLSSHRDEILLNSKLFARIKTIHDQLPELRLDPESERLVKETYKDFVGAGAQLSDDDKICLLYTSPSPRDS